MAIETQEIRIESILVAGEYDHRPDSGFAYVGSASVAWSIVPNEYVGCAPRVVATYANAKVERLIWEWMDREKTIAALCQLVYAAATV